MESSMNLAFPRRAAGISYPVKQLLTAVGGAVVSFGAAALLHFLWEWSGKLLPVAIFALVNESVWEHVKILCWPFLFWSIAEYYILRPDARRLVTARTAGVITVGVLTIVFFYVYTGILGYNIAWVDIASAALWLLAGELVSMRVLNSPAPIENYWMLPAAVMTLVVVMLLCFTASAPHIGLFADPVTGLYGLETMP